MQKPAIFKPVEKFGGAFFVGEDCEDDEPLSLLPLPCGDEPPGGYCDVEGELIR